MSGEAQQRAAEMERLKSLVELARADALSNEEFNELVDAFPVLVERVEAAEKALRLAYPYVKDAWSELPPGLVRKVVENDLEVIAPLLRAGVPVAEEET